MCRNRLGIVITDERIKNYLEEIKYKGSHTNWLNFRLISVTLVKNVTEQSPYPALTYLILNFQKISIEVLLLDMQLSFRSADSCLT